MNTINTPKLLSKAVSVLPFAALAISALPAEGAGVPTGDIRRLNNEIVRCVNTVQANAGKILCRFNGPISQSALSYMKWEVYRDASWNTWQLADSSNVSVTLSNVKNLITPQLGYSKNLPTLPNTRNIPKCSSLSPNATGGWIVGNVIIDNGKDITVDGKICAR